MSTSATPAGDAADVKQAAPVEGCQLVTLAVTDGEGRRISRTMRRTDQLKVLMDLYYDMVPGAEGWFVNKSNSWVAGGWLVSKRISEKDTPAGLRTEDGREIHFFPEVKVVTLVLQDFRGRSFTRTMRRTGRMQDLFDFYAAMVPAAAVSPGIFMYRGEPVKSQQTLAGLGMEDWDRIYFVPRMRGEVAEEKPEHYLTLRVVDFNRPQADVHLTMRSSDKLKVLMDLYRATVLPREAYANFVCDGRWLNGDETPAFLKIEDGDMVDCFPYIV